MATVAKSFLTITQRFHVGASVSESDDLAPHTLESLKVGGFISDGAPVHEAPVAPAEPHVE